MKTLRSFALLIAIALLIPSCVVRPVRGGLAVTPAPGAAAVGVYARLPVGFRGAYYHHAGRYYYGGRWETGRFRHDGRVYSGRYFHNGHYFYGGRFHR